MSAERARPGWPHLFLAALEPLAPGAGAVSALRVRPGEVTAAVAAGGRSHRVSLIRPVLEQEEWERAAAALASQPLFGTRVLAGELPVEVARVFRVLGIDLLPRGVRALVPTCSCREWRAPCAHAEAVLHALARELDRDPFLLTEWSGWPRTRLAERVRRLAREGDAPAGHPPPVPEPPAETALFWAAPDPAAPPPVHPGGAEAVLGAAPEKTPGELLGFLRPLYRRLTGD